MGSSTSKGNISTFMLVVSLLAIIVIAGVITELMLTDGVRAGRYNNPNVASKVVRGTIYDRNGRALALEITKNRLYLVPDEVREKEAIAQVLSIHLNRTPSELLTILNSPDGSERILIADDVDSKTLALINTDLAKYGLPGLQTVKEYVRTYPALFHAAQLIGETEKVYDSVLSPVPGFGESITYGRDVYLELDLDIQYLLDLAVQQVYDLQSPDYAVGFVLDSKTGELLASTTYPFYDLNDSTSIPAQQKISRALVKSITRSDIRISGISIVDKVTVHNSSALVTDYETDASFTADTDAIRTLVREQDGATSIMTLIPETESRYLVFLGSVNPKFYKVPSVMDYALQTIEQGLASQSKL